MKAAKAVDWPEASTKAVPEAYPMNFSFNVHDLMPVLNHDEGILTLSIMAQPLPPEVLEQLFKAVSAQVGEPMARVFVDEALQMLERRVLAHKFAERVML